MLAVTSCAGQGTNGSGTEGDSAQEPAVPGAVAVPAKCADANLTKNLDFEQYVSATAEHDVQVEARRPGSGGGESSRESFAAAVRDKPNLEIGIAATVDGGQAMFAKSACASIASALSVAGFSGVGGNNDAGLDFTTGTLQFGYEGPCALPQLYATNSEKIALPQPAIDPTSRIKTLDILLDSDKLVQQARIQPMVDAAFKFLCPKFKPSTIGKISLPDALGYRSAILQKARSLDICGPAILSEDNHRYGYVYIQQGKVECDTAIKIIAESFPQMSKLQQESGDYTNGFRFQGWTCNTVSDDDRKISGQDYYCYQDQGVVAFRTADR